MDSFAPIKTIMTTKMKTLSPENSFAEVKKIFDQNEFHHIPIVNANKQVVGIISKEDWLNRLQNITRRTTGQTWTNMQYKGLQARDLMTPDPFVLDPDDGIGLAADVFIANKFHAIPIVDHDELKGILTTHDLLRFAFYDILTENI